MRLLKYKYTEADLALIQSAGESLKQKSVELSKKLLSFPLKMTNHQSSSKDFVVLFRDAAIELEVIDMIISYRLMSLAHRLKPNGSFIKKKLNELVLLSMVAEQGICNLGGLNMEFGPTPSFRLLKALSTGSYEKSEVSLLKQFLVEGEIVLELGAGIGYMGSTAIKSGLCKRYIAYEANPNLIPIIKSNMARNNTFFEINNKILLNEKVKQPFYIVDDFWASSLIKPTDDHYQQVSIQAQDKNEIIKLIAPTMLVIDIEGGEADFFKDLHMGSIKKIILEIHPNVLSDNSLCAIYTFLLGEGFILNFKSSLKNVLYWYR